MSKEEPKVTECWAKEKWEAPEGFLGFPMLLCLSPVEASPNYRPAIIMWREDYDALLEKVDVGWDSVRRKYLYAIELLYPHFKSGGRFAHLVTLGQDIIQDGIPALVQDYDALIGKVDVLQRLADRYSREIGEMTKELEELRAKVEELKQSKGCIW